MIERYINIREAAERWNLSSRRVQILCKEGRIDGASKLGREWAIPYSAKKPEDKRIVTGNYKDWRNRQVHTDDNK